MIWFLIVLTFTNGGVTDTHVERVNSQAECIYKGRIAVQNLLPADVKFVCDQEK